MYKEVESKLPFNAKLDSEVSPIAPGSPLEVLSKILIIAPFFLWGTAMVAMKGTIHHTTPMFMAGMRLVPAGVLVLGAAALWGRPILPKGVKAWLWIAFFALVDGAMFQGFLAQGLVRTGAGLGSVMIDSQPLAVALLSAWLFGEIIGIWGVAGLLLGVAGISLIGIPDEWIFSLLQGNIKLTNAVNFGHIFESGELWMLMAALSMAVGTVTMRQVAFFADPVAATGWHMILGGLPLWAISWATESQQWVNIDGYGWMALAYSTVFGSAIAYGIFFYFAAFGNLTSLSSLTFLTPVFALIFGHLLLSETLSPLQTFGVFLTLGSIYLIQQRAELAVKFPIFQSRQKATSHSPAGETDAI